MLSARFSKRVPVMPKKQRVTLVFDHLQSFVKNDLDILSERYEVVPFKYGGKGDIPGLARAIMGSDAVMCWFAIGFATTSTFLARLFRKRSVVVAGGWDVALDEDLGYGFTIRPNNIKKVRFALEKADLVLPVSESSKREVERITGSARMEVLYNGIDAERFVPGLGQKEDMAVTVGGITRQTIRKKGIETFVRSAEHLPEVRFCVAGRSMDDSIDHLKRIAAPNVEFLGFVPDDELLRLYQRAKVYVQVSGHESFGCSLAEGMACDCVPVATRRAALPEVVGDTGFYVEFEDPKGTAKAIEKALVSDLGPRARQRVCDLYTIAKRRDRLLGLMDGLLGSGGTR